MTFINLKFVFLKKVVYNLLYNNKNISFSIFKKIKTNFLKIHNEKILIFNFLNKKKNFFFINLIINKKMCKICKKNLYFIKNFFCKQ